MGQKELSKKLEAAQKLLQEWQAENKDQRAVLLTVAERDDKGLAGNTAILGQSAMTIEMLLAEDDKGVRDYVTCLCGANEHPIKRCITHFLALGKEEADHALVDSFK